MKKTATMTGRVGSDLEATCIRIFKEKGLTKSKGVEQALQQYVTDPPVPHAGGGTLFSQRDGIDQVVELPDEINEIFKTLGVSALVGGGVYFGTLRYQKKVLKASHDDAHDIALRAAIGFGVVTMGLFAIGSLLKQS